jgi:catechol 2,3-dioxygenase-like lactoylglutathione lyase family enzyme
MTTRVVNVSVPVRDQHAATRFYVDVLGFERCHDVEVWPGARFVEVTPHTQTESMWGSLGSRCRD